MPEKADTIFIPEKFAEGISIEWKVSEEQKQQLNKIVKKIYKNGRKVWGLISREGVILGDSNTAYTVSPEIPSREFSVNKIPDNQIDELEANDRNGTKHNVYAALHQEPITLEQIFQITMTNEQEIELRKILLNKISNQIDELLNE